MVLASEVKTNCGSGFRAILKLGPQPCSRAGGDVADEDRLTGGPKRPTSCANSLAASKLRRVPRCAAKLRRLPLLSGSSKGLKLMPARNPKRRKGSNDKAGAQYRRRLGHEVADSRHLIRVLLKSYDGTRSGRHRVHDGEAPWLRGEVPRMDGRRSRLVFRGQGPRQRAFQRQRCAT